RGEANRPVGITNPHGEEARAPEQAEQGEALANGAWAKRRLTDDAWHRREKHEVPPTASSLETRLAPLLTQDEGIERLVALAAYRPQRSCQIFSPIMQETRGSFSATRTTGRSGVRPATSSSNLVRIASLNFSRSLIETTNEPGPPITQSS